MLIFRGLNMRGLVLPVMLLVLSAAVAGCGGGSMSLDPVASAATNTEKSGAFSFSFKESFDIKGHALAITGQGVADLATQASRMSLDIAGLPAAMNKNGTTGEAEQIGTVLYMKLPFLQGQLPDGRRSGSSSTSRKPRAPRASISAPRRRSTSIPSKRSRSFSPPAVPSESGRKRSRASR